MIFKMMDLYRRYRFKNRYFMFDDTPLNYFYHSYNNSGYKSRAVEIPITAYYLRKERPMKTLEIGNVTNYYYDVFKDLFNIRDVVDKYETGYDVINIDIKDYKISRDKYRYDMAISISTFEHMDSDGGDNHDYIRKLFPMPGKGFSSNAMNNINHVIEHLLKPGGLLLLTFPVMYGNHEIDDSILNDEDAMLDAGVTYYFMERKNELTWKQVPSPRKGRHETICVMKVRK